MPTAPSTKPSQKGNSRRDYSHPEVVALMREARKGEVDPEDIVRRKCREIVASAKKDGWEGPPFNPFILASLRGIKTKQVESLPQGEARLLGRRGEAIIEYLKDSILPERLRFTICHEITHTIFPGCFRLARNFGAVPLTKAELEFERLCDVGAGELLMPLEEFKADLAKKLLCLNHVCDLKGRYEASIDAATKRCLDLTERCHAAVFFSRSPPIGGNGVPNDGLVVKYYWRSGAFRVFIRPGMKAPRNSVIHQALFSQTETSVATHAQPEYWRPTGKPTAFVVQAIALPAVPTKPDYPKVMALITPHG